MALPKFESPGLISEMPTGVHDAVSWGEAKHCAFAWPAEDGSDKLLACFQKGTETFFQKLPKGYVIAVRVCPAHYSTLETLDAVDETSGVVTSEPTELTITAQDPTSAMKKLIGLLGATPPPPSPKEKFETGQRVLWYGEPVDAEWGVAVYRGELLVPATDTSPHEVLRDDGEMWAVAVGVLYDEETEKDA